MIDREQLSELEKICTVEGTVLLKCNVIDAGRLADPRESPKSLTTPFISASVFMK